MLIYGAGRQNPGHLIANTWIEMNGYNWFKIRTSTGKEGYKWGGILCSDALHVPGLYDKCM